MKRLINLLMILFTRQEQSDGWVGVHDDQALSGFVGSLTDELVLIGKGAQNGTGNLFAKHVIKKSILKSGMGLTIYWNWVEGCDKRKQERSLKITKAKAFTNTSQTITQVLPVRCIW